METKKVLTRDLKDSLLVWVFIDNEDNIMLERNPEAGDPRGIASSINFWHLPGYSQSAADPAEQEHLKALWREQRDRLYGHDCTAFLETLIVRATGFHQRETFQANLLLCLQAYYVEDHDQVPLKPPAGTERKFFSVEDAMVHYPVGYQDRAVIACFMEHMRW
ncbi:hypothetical protein [Kordiimonas aestuarii]|uniref:hypothetical protein n=1 Tax=Kordiimonas aestuarii TaxID=1005925 RepID=UPI0021D2D472|nr:hypothetical protein [Kordiimonas aestuarii]